MSKEIVELIMKLNAHPLFPVASVVQTLKAALREALRAHPLFPALNSTDQPHTGRRAGGTKWIPNPEQRKIDLLLFACERR